MRAQACRSAVATLMTVAAVVACGGGGTEVDPFAPGPAGEGAGPAAGDAGIAPRAGATTGRDPLPRVPAGAPRLTITVDDTEPGRFRYRAPRSVTGGLVEIRLRNVSNAPHKAQLWRVGGNHTVAQALRVGRRLPDWLRRAGGVSLTAPQTTSRTLQALPAGRYYVAADADRPGRVAAFTVTGPRTAPDPPRAPARVEAIDFSFRVSGLRAGRNTVDFDNTGVEPHHAFFAPMRDGVDLADVRRFFGERTSTGRPPVDTEGTRETVVLEGGERQVTQLDFAPGRYALVCFVRGRAGGRRHLELGMINEVTVR